MDKYLKMLIIVIYNVLVQECASGQVCYVNQYHYETYYIHNALVQEFASGQACCGNQYHYKLR